MRSIFFIVMTLWQRVAKLALYCIYEHIVKFIFYFFWIPFYNFLNTYIIICIITKKNYAFEFG